MWMVSYRFVTLCVCVAHDVCIMLGSSLVFLAFLLCDDGKESYHICFITTALMCDGRAEARM